MLVLKGDLIGSSYLMHNSEPDPKPEEQTPIVPQEFGGICLLIPAVHLTRAWNNQSTL